MSSRTTDGTPSPRSGSPGAVSAGPHGGGRRGFGQRARRTREQPISYMMQQAVANPDLISLAAGLVDAETLPVAECRRLIADLLADDSTARAALQYGTTEGYGELRELLVEWIEALEGVPSRDMALRADNVVVTTGSQQLLYLLSDVLLDPGDIVLVGAPEYFVYMGTLESLGARVVGVPMDDAGLVPEGLAEVLERLEREGDLPRVKLLYHGSYFQNPTGVTTVPERRPRILEVTRRWSRRRRILVLEDAAYRELVYEGDSPRSIRSYDAEGEDVVLTQTFSKSFSPGLKTGYSVLPADLVAPVLQQKGNHDFGSNNFTQHLLAAALRTGTHAAHVERLKRTYRQKQTAMRDALEEAFPGAGVPARCTRTRGGLYNWVVLPEEIDTRRGGPLFRAALERGVLYLPGQFCFPAESPARPADPLGGPRNTLRLTFGNLTVDGIREGIGRLAEALRAVS